MIPNYNTEKAITSFSLGDLNRMAGRETAPGWMDECIVATSGTRMREFRDPCRIDAYIIGVGAEGETIQTFNLKEYRLKKDTLFIFPPKNILYRTDSGDTFKAHIIISPVLLQRVNIDMKRFTPLLLQFAAHPCLELTPEESRMMRGYIATIERELQAPETEFSNGIIEGLISVLICKVGSMLRHYLAEHPEEEKPVLNRTEEYFRRFTTLLGEHYTHERSVGFYARQLCITPKYLTTMIKQISGKSTSEWIDTSVIRQAKTLLQ